MTCTPFQIALLGSGRVGKTCILQRYMYGTFLKEYVETVEDLYSQPYIIDGRQQNIDFIDTAGNISFPAMRQIYISKAHGFVLVYSISDKNSYEEMKKLWEQIKLVRKNILNIPVVVIGNHLDEENIRQIETFDALDWACGENLGGCFLEVSAKANKYIHDIFKILFEQFGNTRSKQKGPLRFRSTSICRMVSESEPGAPKRKTNSFRRSKTVGSDLHDEFSQTYQDMVFDDYKDANICRLKRKQNGPAKQSTTKRNLLPAIRTVQNKLSRSVSFLSWRLNRDLSLCEEQSNTPETCLPDVIEGSKLQSHVLNTSLHTSSKTLCKKEKTFCKKKSESVPNDLGASRSSAAFKSSECTIS